MNRFDSAKIAVIAIAMVTLGPTLAMAQSGTQSASQRTLADRFGELRQGWSFSSDQPTAEEPSPPAPTQAAPATTVSDTPAAFPRVNPRELLPREWFGVGVEEVRARKKASAGGGSPTPAAAATDANTGSARARLLRDLRRPNIATDSPTPVEPGFTRRPAARAGSVLSPGGKATATEPSAAGSIGKGSIGKGSIGKGSIAKGSTEGEATAKGPTNPQIAKAIAAEVAQAMQTPTTEASAQLAGRAPLVAGLTGPGLPAAQPNSRESDGAELSDAAPSLDTREATPAIGPIVAMPSRGTPTANADSQKFDAAAESDSGRLRVAANPQAPTKLPLFIGQNYSQPEAPTSVTVETAAESAAAENAFAAPIAAPPSEAPVADTNKSQTADDFLMTQRLPVLVSRVGGPRTITVGREATYRVLLANRGDIGADGVVTTVRIPDWADVIDASAAAGTIEPSDSMAVAGELTWKTDHLAAGQVIQLDLRLIARAGKPIQLGVTHTHLPIDGSTTVEVQEPKLALAMVGPSEVHFGRAQTFRLTISNPGTGAAAIFALSLTPPGGDTTQATTHKLGSIEANGERTVEIELTAREAGQLAINAAAEAEGDVSARMSKEVFCRKPELVVDWKGPTERYAGAPARYYFRVRNPGTAIAPDVVLTAELPAGFEAIPGPGTPKIESGKLAYRVGSLKPGDDRYFELRGKMREAGANTIALRAAAADETRSPPVEVVTEVVALADLKLEVRDPRGPIATGQEAEYQIIITNRGTSNAHEVKIVGLFSEGIEPHHVEGAQSTINDGRVAFDKIDRLAVGEEKVLTIHARAHRAGSLLFRAEVVCRDLEIKLAAEETTRFFEDEAINVAGDGYPSHHLGSYPR